MRTLVQTGTQDPDRHVQAGTGHGVDLLARLALAKIVLEFADMARKIVHVTPQAAPQRICRHRVGPRRASHPEVDTAWIELSLSRFLSGMMRL
jgi:hypothetical protein